MAFRPGCGFSDAAELGGQEGEVAHGGLEVSVEGALLERGEQGVQFVQVFFHQRLLSLHRFDDGGEFGLEGEGRLD